MSDLFHPGVPRNFIRTTFKVMQLADWHLYQVLTKRADQMQRLIAKHLPELEFEDQIWLGTSVENRKHGLPRIQHLRDTPAAVRFLSCEPLLEDLGLLDLGGIDWVIVGGESGPGARPMRLEWVESLLEQCKKADIPFFFKQWGGVQKKRKGRLLHGATFDEFPDVHLPPPPSASERQERREQAQHLIREVQTVA